MPVNLNYFNWVQILFTGKFNIAGVEIIYLIIIEYNESFQSRFFVVESNTILDPIYLFLSLVFLYNL